MFDEQPSYLGGMTTVMQDSMNGVQYGRENVNDGRYVPNQGAQGTVYRNTPEMKKPDAAVSAKLKDLVKKYTEGFEPVQFHGLKVPSSLVKWMPDPYLWVDNLSKYEQALASGVDHKMLVEGDISFSPIALEILQPGTWNTDIPTQITRVQKLKGHLMEQMDITTFKPHENASRKEEEARRNALPPNVAQNNVAQNNAIHNQQAPVHNQQAPVHNQQAAHNQQTNAYPNNHAALPHNQVAPNNGNNIVQFGDTTPWYMTGKGMVGIAVVAAIGWGWYKNREI